MFENNHKETLNELQRKQKQIIELGKRIFDLKHDNGKYHYKETSKNRGILFNDDEYELLNNLLDFYIDYEKRSLYTGKFEEVNKAEDLKSKIKHYKK